MFKTLTDRARNLRRRLTGKKDESALDMDKALAIAKAEGEESYAHEEQGTRRASVRRRT